MSNMNTERLRISKVKENDANALFKVWSNPKVTEYMNIPPMQSEKQAVEMIRFFQQADKENTACRMSIFLKNSGLDALGTCGFNYLDFENDRAEIGYEICDEYWRKGYMSEVLTELIKYGFEKYSLNRIEAKVELDNIPSQKLLEKIGFTNEGVLRDYEKHNERFKDIVILSILKEEWGTFS